MKDIYQLENKVNEYMKRHGMSLKHSKRNIDTNVYIVVTTDYTLLESKIITTKNGINRAVFQVDGKIASLYK